MIYIDLIQNDNEFSFYSLKKYNKIINKIILFFYKITGKVLKINIENKNVLLLTNLSKTTLKNLEKKFLELNSQIVCLSKNLEKNEDLRNFLREKDKNILDGSWLFSCLVEDVLKYIENQMEMDLDKAEIAILTNELNDFQAAWIVKLAKEYKRLDIVTRQPERFNRLKEYLYSEFGIELNISYNERKSLKNSNIILNFNFVQDAINKFTIFKKAIIINFENEIQILSKSFSGININNYQIHLPTAYMKYMIPFQKFPVNILYESFVYSKTSLENILEKIEKDKLEIQYLIGVRGKIKKQEYLKVKTEIKK